jgi:predicted transcriptional regulator
MPTVTLRLPDRHYRLFRKLAQEENRSLSNFIETATIRHIEESEYTDSIEMEEIKTNKKLISSLKKGHADARLMKGHFVD